MDRRSALQVVVAILGGFMQSTDRALVFRQPNVDTISLSLDDRPDHLGFRQIEIRYNDEPPIRIPAAELVAALRKP